MTIFLPKISTFPARGLVWSCNGAIVVVILPSMPSISIKPAVRVPVIPTLLRLTLSVTVSISRVAVELSPVSSRVWAVRLSEVTAISKSSLRICRSF